MKFFFSIIIPTYNVENIIKDRFEHWLSNSPQQADNLLSYIIEITEMRLRRREEKETTRKLVFW